MASVFNQGKQSSFFKPVIQHNLTINQPGDVYEQEADAVADKIMRMGNSSIQNFFSAPGIRRKCAACEEEEKKVQRMQAGNNNYPSSPHTENYLSSLHEGRPLNNSERTFFESKLGYDFFNVRIHADSAANQSAKDIHARAYTYGNDIVFGENQYQPGTTEGKKLLAHELTHVIQQNEGSPGNYIQRKVSYEGEDIEEDMDPLTPGKRAAGTTNIIVNNASLKGLDWGSIMNLAFPLPQVEKVTKKFLCIRKDHCMVTNKNIDVIVKSILHVLKPGPWIITIPVSRLKEYSGRTPSCRPTGDTTTLMIQADAGEEKIRDHVLKAEMQHASDNACLVERYLKSYEADVLALPDELPIEEAEACDDWLENHLKRKERAKAFANEYKLFGDSYDVPGGPHLLDFIFQYDLLDCSNVVVKVSPKPLPKFKRDCSAWPVP